ncbi:hypothetical protein K440DRAFT_102927 [Wilcoxina mikolae CBS 423.85]|nr:hypothetical protein K440DRAFT_102927 [Wilcoxina mikolae CBS 423.85]
MFHNLSLCYLGTCVSFSATTVWIVPPENVTDRLACAYLWGVLYCGGGCLRISTSGSSNRPHRSGKNRQRSRVEFNE